MSIEKTKAYSIKSIIDKNQYEKFKDFAKTKGENPAGLLYRIQDKMGIPEKEKGHFGPKTIKYLENLYKQEQVGNVLNDKEKYSDVLEKGQKNLDNLNNSTGNLVSKNIVHTKNDFYGSLKFGYNSGSGEGKAFDNIKKDSVSSEVSKGGITYIEGLGYLYNEGGEKYYDSQGNYLQQGNDLKYAINNQVNDVTIEEEKKSKEFFESLGFDIGKVDTKKKTPIDILGDMYKKASEDDKIKMAMVLGEYMGNHYDYDMANSGNNGDISSEEMWEIYRKDGVAGVCRHMHSEVAMFLEKAGITAGTITTNSGGRHDITLGKKADGSYFLIDYNNYFESKDFMELKNQYLASHGTIDLKEIISDPSGKVIKVIQTALEKEFENNTSSVGTGNTMDYSKQLAKNGIQLIKGTKVDGTLENTKKGISISHGIDTKYGHYEGGLVYNENNSGLGYTDKYSSVGAYLKGKWGNRYNTIGEFGAGIKYTKNTFNWNNGKKTSYNTLSANIDWTKNLVNTETDNVNIGASIQGNMLLDVTEGRDTYALLDSPLGKVQDGVGSAAATVDWHHKFNENWSSDLGLMYGFDVLPENLRRDDLKMYSKYGVYGGLNYEKDDLKASLKGGYEKGLGYKKYTAKASVKKENVEVYGKYSKEKDTTYFKIPKKVKKEVGIKYNIDEALQASVSLYDNNDYGRKDKGIRAGVEYKFG